MKKHIIIVVLLVIGIIGFVAEKGILGKYLSSSVLSAVTPTVNSGSSLKLQMCNGARPDHSMIIADVGATPMQWQYAVDKDVTTTVNGVTMILIKKQSNCTFKCENNYEYNQPNNACELGLVASLTANGSNNLIVTPGTVVTYAWSSNKAVSATSTYTTNKASCGAGGTWIANTIKGSVTSTIPTSYVGCIFTLTYTAKNSAGKSVSSIATITIQSTVPKADK